MSPRSRRFAARREQGDRTEFNRVRKSQIGSHLRPIALSRFCYRRRKTLAPQGPRKLPKLDVAGSTPVAPYSGRKQLGSVDREDCNPHLFRRPTDADDADLVATVSIAKLCADLAAAGFIEP